MKNLTKLISLLSAAFCFSYPNLVDAGFQITLQANGSTETITDGGALDGDGTVDGIVVINRIVGGVTFSGAAEATSNATNNADGIDIIAMLDADINIEGSLDAGASASILASASGFITPITPPAIVVETSVTGTQVSGMGSPYTTTVYLDTSNSLSTTNVGTQIGIASDTSTTGFDQIGANTTALLPEQTVSPFALNLLVSLMNTTDSAQTYDTNFDGAAMLSHVPEPTSMAIMGLGTLLAGFGVRRRKRKMAEMAA